MDESTGKPQTMADYDDLIARLEAVGDMTRWSPAVAEVRLSLIREAIAALRIAAGNGVERHPK